MYIPHFLLLWWRMASALTGDGEVAPKGRGERCPCAGTADSGYLQLQKS